MGQVRRWLPSKTHVTTQRAVSMSSLVHMGDDDIDTKRQGLSNSCDLCFCGVVALASDLDVISRHRTSTGSMFSIFKALVTTEDERQQDC